MNDFIRYWPQLTMQLLSYNDYKISMNFTLKLNSQSTCACKISKIPPPVFLTSHCVVPICWFATEDRVTLTAEVEATAIQGVSVHVPFCTRHLFWYPTINHWKHKAIYEYSYYMYNISTKLILIQVWNKQNN